jgi:RHS repeat-associated protein
MDSQKRVAIARVGPALPGDNTPAVKYHLGDHLGSSNLVVDNTGALVNQEEYLPYGETSFGSFARKQYRFTGKERDSESGLYYHGARYYAPWLGRWVSCDPVGPVDGPNLYEYARSDPERLVDTTGKESGVTEYPQDVWQPMVIEGKVNGATPPDTPVAAMTPDLPFDPAPVIEPPAGATATGFQAAAPELLTPAAEAPVGAGLGSAAGGIGTISLFPGIVAGCLYGMYSSQLKLDEKVRRLNAARGWHAPGVVGAPVREPGSPQPAMEDQGSPVSYEDPRTTVPQQMPGAQAQVDEMVFAQRKHNTSFMQEQLENITSTPGHPLSFLVDPSTGTWRSRQKYSQDPTVQAGHLTSLHSDAPEQLALEDSTFNQWSSNRGESQGAIFIKTAVDIWGVPVEFRTALEWVRAGLLSPDVVFKACFSPGWKP